MAPTQYYVVLSAILFSIGAMGVLTKKNPVVIPDHPAYPNYQKR